MTWGVHREGACGVECGRGHAWGHEWQGACVSGGVCVAGGHA